MLHFCKLSNYIIQTNVILMYVFLGVLVLVIGSFPQRSPMPFWHLPLTILPPRFATKPARRTPRKRWTPAILLVGHQRPSAHWLDDVGWYLPDRWFFQVFFQENTRTGSTGKKRTFHLNTRAASSGLPQNCLVTMICWITPLLTGADTSKDP